jgi:hypothetical protein
MGKKMFYVAMVWFFTIFVYIILAASMPALKSITGEASTLLTATSNMSNYPGTLAAVDSAPVWLWFIPGFVSIVATVVMLKQPNDPS